MMCEQVKWMASEPFTRALGGLNADFLVAMCRSVALQLPTKSVD